jgi:hypothetical protein
MIPSPSTALVLVGFAEALAAPESVWSLVDAGFTVHAFTRRGQPSALAHSRHVVLHAIPVPESDLAGAQAALALLLGDLQSDDFAHHVLMPLDDTALWLCGRTPLPAQWNLAGPTPGAGLDLSLDKRQQIEFALEAGFDVPQTLLVRRIDDLDPPPLPFPMILRAADARRQSGQRLTGGRNWICSDVQELAAARAGWAGIGDLLVQPYLEGVGEGIFGLMTDDGVIAWSAHRRLRMMNPHGSGSSACVSRSVDEALKEPVTRFLRSIHWRGMFMFEFLRLPGGRVVFVEFNGRAWGSMALARRQGLEYPAWSARQALGLAIAAPPVSEPSEGLVCRNLGRELMHLLFVLRGRRSRAVRAWPSMVSALRDVLRIQRGSSFYNWRRGDWRVFASDCYYTVARHLRRSG